MDPEADRRLNRLQRRIVIAAIVAALLVVGGWVYGRLEATPRSPKGDHDTNAMSGPRAVATFSERFPRIDLVEGLLDPPVALNRQLGWRQQVLDPVVWTDGVPVLLCGRRPRVEALGLDLLSRGALYIERDLRSIHDLPSPHGATRWVGIAGPEEAAFATSAVGIDARGATTWRWDATDSIESIAVLFDERGASGVILVVEGEQGIVALDLDGHPLWNAPKRLINCEVCTHPRLPGRVLLVDGGFALLDGDGHVSLTSEHDGVESRHSHLVVFTDGGILLPGPERSASMVLAGKRYEPREEPLLVRLDENDHEEWSATPRSEIDSVGLVEPPERPRLVVATTTDGDLLVIDEHGTLRGHTRLPLAPEGRQIATYMLAAGRLGADGWFVAVQLRKATYVYRLHPELLPKT